MAYIEDRVESLEETAERLLKLSDQILQMIRESANERERQYKEWLDRFEREKNDWNEKFEKEKIEWNERFEKEKKEWKERFEIEKRDWNERFEKEKKEWKERFEIEKREWNEKFEKEKVEWNEKFEKEKREDRKKWEEMVLRLGTLVEDIVAPSIPNIAKRYFGCVDIEFDGLRIKKRHTKEKGKIKEFDYILICDNIILVNETKANPKPEYAKEFIEFIKSGEFWDYFPEYTNKRFIPVFSTLYMPDDIVKYLTKNRIYAIAMKGDEMDILNYKEINGG